MKTHIVVALFVAASFISSEVYSKTIDMRNQTDGDGGIREISFCARPSPDKPGLPGHAFIAFSETSKNGKRVFRAIGHTVFSVGEALLSYTSLVTADGALMDEKYTSIKQECLTLQVNKADFDKSYGLVAQPLQIIGVTFDETKPIQKSYSLAANDCVGFLIKQAQLYSPKITVPSRNNGELPLNYLRRLIDAN
ncbi:hypothetical protein [Methylophilus sp. 14]|uniref:hypothetical protein n=1 Tax=Methylophilus sp. 14 TaxID=2781019 RepID=UPI00188FC7BA|nr:hypothetical protein [Methylophilus sp. 14]MBF4989473.1 hypothetical protein [Methylophilus sp. 14]